MGIPFRSARIEGFVRGAALQQSGDLQTINHGIVN
jgi:hypothetical protein